MIIQGDCVAEMAKMEQESVDLIFADPPFNIGKKYLGCWDKNAQYYYWTNDWISLAFNLLKKNGSMFVAIGDKHVCDVKRHLDTRMHFRSWIIWHYEFGMYCKKTFGRCHTHILYYSKSEKDFTFNSDAILVESARQKMGDKRASPKGKIPGDVWKFSRVCGTFNERAKGANHPCQMPLDIMDRIIRVASNEGDLVLDPFAGTGTTLLSAAKNNRRWIGIEQSPVYCDNIKKRLDGYSNS